VKQTRLFKNILGKLFQTAIGRKIICPKRIIVYKPENSNHREAGLIVKLMVQNERIQVLNFAKSAPSSANSLPYMSFVPGFAKHHLPPFTLNQEFMSKTISLQSVDMVTTMICETDTYDLLHNNRQEIALTMDKLAHSLKFQSKWSEASLERVRDPDLRAVAEERKRYIEEIAKSQCINCPNFPKIFNQVNDQFLIKEQIESLKAMISDQNLELLPDYEQRIEVLKDLNYIDSELNVLLKGRVACEVSTGFELIVSELVLENFLGGYEPEEIVALMSCFVFEGNTNQEMDTVTPKLDAGRNRILDIVQRVNQVYDSHQVLMTQEETEFTERNRFGLMEAVYEWARGMTFNSITALTDVQEGTIVRVITRLDEICREVMAAARIIGDTSLHDKMAIAQEKIKRDIVFCASLYL
jgi:antiviral helicase SKI2